jgi:hypothetical protein
VETIHDVWRLLVAKAADCTMQADEAERALGIIAQHEADYGTVQDVPNPDPAPKTKKGGA